MDWKSQVNIDHNWMEKIVIHLGRRELNNDTKPLCRLLLTVGWLLRGDTNLSTNTNLFFFHDNLYEEENKWGKKRKRYVENVYIMLD